MADYLWRYTDFASLIYLLRERKITLLSPDLWDDKNDKYFLQLYRDRMKFKTVLALCFATTYETYHHWRVFAGGNSGVCIRFKRAQFLQAVKQRTGVIARPVKYLTVDATKVKPLKVTDLPFRKRYAYKNEAEFRFIYQTRLLTRKTLDVDIPLSSIDRIILSPWVPDALFTHLRTTIKRIPQCKNLKVGHSTLISSDNWMEAGDKAV
jgi:hypothetical protein